jgi:integrase
MLGTSHAKWQLRVIRPLSNVPAHMVQRWLGHASLRTSAIYGDVVGPEERGFAEQM